MSLEDEMKREIRRLENEISALDVQIDKLNARISELLRMRQKKERGLHILKSNFGEAELRDSQTTLFGVVKAK